MGKGDRRTTKGKIKSASYGNKRVHKVSEADQITASRVKSARLKKIAEDYKKTRVVIAPTATPAKASAETQTAESIA